MRIAVLGVAADRVPEGMAKLPGQIAGAVQTLHFPQHPARDHSSDAKGKKYNITGECLRLILGDELECLDLLRSQLRHDEHPASVKNAPASRDHGARPREQSLRR